jgi:hypothetical protein
MNSARLLAIDPGACTGWAVYAVGELVACGVTGIDAVDCPAVRALVSMPGIGELVIERPQVYRPKESKGDPNDLIKVAIEVGRWVERASLSGARVLQTLPNEWKGQVPKDVHHRRALAILSDDERAAIPSLPRTYAHNALDAVALGLWRLGRLRR